MKPAIEIRNLGKQYSFAEAQPYLSLRDSIHSSFKKMTKPGKTRQSKFWALQDINLDIEPGERLGIIGRNGAGKSTLLKILSKITPPTKGEVKFRGRIASLLEVGTGFHPELTGRENIFLNGAILGMSRKEIELRLDEIIDFSGVEKFIDTTLKHYSSGMQLRLAFSVAAHLEPEILLIDEVLAVGDMEFQKKCLGKMEEVSKTDGRTILFVSHNMSYISGLCDKAILLDKGKLVCSGQSSHIINEYIKIIGQNGVDQIAGNETAGLIEVILIDNLNAKKDSFNVTEKIGIKMRYEVKIPGKILWLGYNVHNEDGMNVFDTHSVNTELYTTPHDTGLYEAVAWIPGNLLNTGIYFISCAVFNHLENIIHFHAKDVRTFHIHDSLDKTTARGMSPGKFPGIVRPLLDWKIKKIADEK